ncbi:MAG: S8 family peptidase [Lachnospiraceae bacterium]|nr:S8 family peptidase [Lachnospiraceae bacterium]
MPENESESCREIITSQDYQDFIMRYTGKEVPLTEQYPFVRCTQVVNDKYMIVHAASEALPDRDQFAVSYNFIPKCYGLLDTSNLESSGVLRLRRQPYLNLYGEGVLVGFIDTGIDYRHPAFRYSDGTTRIAAIWDQSIQTGELPEGFQYGSEYTKEMIDLALASDDPYSVVPSRDTSGHGTFMAGIAVGSEIFDADFSGIAPRADIAAVKLKQAKNYLRDYLFIGREIDCFQENDIIMAIRYLETLAEKRNQPLVLCFGIGTNSGDHNGYAILDDVISDVGRSFERAVTAAAGNEANLGHHFRGGPIAGEYEEVELRVAEGENGFFLELWASAPNIFSIALQTPGGEAVSRISPRIDQNQRITFLFEPTVVYIEYRLLEVRTGDMLIAMRFLNPTPGIWRLRVYDDVKRGGIYDIWLPMEGFVEPDTRFLNPDPEITICGPGNSEWVITSATYNHVNDSIYLNSSRGYTRNGAVKPDIASPGVNVYGPVPGGGYSRRTGSSIASAHAAGAAALIQEWGVVQEHYIYMDCLETKKLLIRGAQRSENLIYPNPQWGYGMLNIYESFRSIRTSG